MARRIGVLDSNQFATDNPCVHVSKSVANLMVQRLQAEYLCDGRMIRKFAVKVVAKDRFPRLDLEICFDYDYPDFIFDPEMQHIPGCRYPVFLAPHQA